MRNGKSTGCLASTNVLRGLDDAEVACLARHSSRQKECKEREGWKSAKPSSFVWLEACYLTCSILYDTCGMVQMVQVAQPLYSAWVPSMVVMTISTAAGCMRTCFCNSKLCLVNSSSKALFSWSCRSLVQRAQTMGHRAEIPNVHVHRFRRINARGKPPAKTLRSVNSMRMLKVEQSWLTPADYADRAKFEHEHGGMLSSDLD